MINVISSSRYKINRTLIKKGALEYLAQKDVIHHGTLNIVFVGRNKMKAIATKYKNEPVALPVLSFNYGAGPEQEQLSEIVICYPQAVLLAAERGKRVDDMISFLVNHAIDTLQS